MARHTKNNDQISTVKRTQEAGGKGQETDDDLSPQERELATEFRRHLGTLDPRQIAIWCEMTPAQKIRLVSHIYDLARRIIWATERQAHPDASPEELTWRMLRHLHGTEFCASLQVSMERDGIGLADFVQNSAVGN
jgi:hypothetical protein